MQTSPPTSWPNSEPQASTRPRCPDERSATFDEDRTLVLTTGCNDLRSAWSLDGNQLTLEAPAQTMMACDQPAGVMEQEAALAAVLTDAETVEVTPNTLTILDDAGTILILATKA